MNVSFSRAPFVSSQFLENIGCQTKAVTNFRKFLQGNGMSRIRVRFEIPYRDFRMLSLLASFSRKYDKLKISVLLEDIAPAGTLLLLLSSKISTSKREQ